MTKTNLLRGAAAIDPRLVRADAEEEGDLKEKEREDADKGTPLAMEIPDARKLMDAIEGCMDAIKSTNERMDAMDARRKDSEKEREDAHRRDNEEDVKEEKAVADKKRKDGEAEEEGEPTKPVADKRKDAEKEEGEGEREDATRDDARADAVTVADLRKQMASMESTIRTLSARSPAPLADEDAHLVAMAQARADDVFVQFGDRAPRPQVGEDVMSYRRRVLRDLKQHSPSLKDANVYGVTDAAVFDKFEETVYADAVAAANNPANVPAGRLQTVEREVNGHTFREFRGEPRSWMNPIAGAAVHKVEGTWGG